MSHGYAGLPSHLGGLGVQRGEQPLHEGVHGRGRAEVSLSTIDIDSTVPGLDANFAAALHHHQARPRVQLERDRAHHRGDVARTVAERLLVRAGRPRGDRNYSNNTISVTYLVDEGARLYVERIDIVRQHQDARLRRSAASSTSPKATPTIASSSTGPSASSATCSSSRPSASPPSPARRPTR